MGSGAKMFSVILAAVSTQILVLSVSDEEWRVASISALCAVIFFGFAMIDYD